VSELDLLGDHSWLPFCSGWQATRLPYEADFKVAHRDDGAGCHASVFARINEIRLKSTRRRYG
jgi:hypothetical protein